MQVSDYIIIGLLAALIIANAVVIIKSIIKWNSPDEEDNKHT